METQVQYSQLSLRFSGPLVAEWQVENLDELINLDYNYDHRIVWVKSEKCMYVLTEGMTGNNLTHWKKYGKEKLLEYSNIVSYSIHDCVFDNTGIYIALKDVPESTPLTDTQYWLKVSSNVITLKETFVNKTYIEIATQSLGIDNPIFQIFINNKQVESDISLVDNEYGEVWRISFYENNLPAIKSGYVLIK